jgi:hypothetical protein
MILVDIAAGAVPQKRRYSFGLQIRHSVAIGYPRKQSRGLVDGAITGCCRRLGVIRPNPDTGYSPSSDATARRKADEVRKKGP